MIGLECPIKRKGLIWAAYIVKINMSPYPDSLQHIREIIFQHLLSTQQSSWTPTSSSWSLSQGQQRRILVAQIGIYHTPGISKFKAYDKINWCDDFTLEPMILLSASPLRTSKVLSAISVRKPPGTSLVSSGFLCLKSRLYILTSTSTGSATQWMKAFGFVTESTGKTLTLSSTT